MFQVVLCVSAALREEIPLRETSGFTTDRTKSTKEKPNLRAIREVLEDALDGEGTGRSVVKSLLVKQTIGMFGLIAGIYTIFNRKKIILF